MDNDYALNLDEIFRTIETADVLRVRFLLINKRVLFDIRFNELDGPLIRVVSRSGSSEESFRNLKRLRPRFPLPDKMTAIWWPKYVSSLVSTGVWQAIINRIAESGYSESVSQCETIFRELQSLERQEIRNAISGEGFQTIWQRTAI